jgi:hypothetical protein
MGIVAATRVTARAALRAAMIGHFRLVPMVISNALARKPERIV